MVASWLGQVMKRTWLLMCIELRRRLQMSDGWSYLRLTMSVVASRSSEGV